MQSFLVEILLDTIALRDQAGIQRVAVAQVVEEVDGMPNSKNMEWHVSPNTHATVLLITHQKVMLKVTGDPVALEPTWPFAVLAAQHQCMFKENWVYPPGTITAALGCAWIISCTLRVEYGEEVAAEKEALKKVRYEGPELPHEVPRVPTRLESQVGTLPSQTPR